MRVQSGTVGITSGTLSRYTAFHIALHELDYPDGTKLSFAAGVSVVDNLNMLVRQMVGDWFMPLGDDHIFRPNFLRAMLKAVYDNDLDVCVPLCVKRSNPYAPVVFRGRDDGKFDHITSTADLPSDKLIEVEAAGNAGMVIRRRVLEALGEPWFKGGPRETGTVQLVEDLRFCEDVRALGFHIHCAPWVRLGHMTSVVLWPQDDGEGGWGLNVQFGSLGRDSVSIARKSIQGGTERD